MKCSLYFYFPKTRKSSIFFCRKKSVSTKIPKREQKLVHVFEMAFHRPEPNNSLLLVKTADH